MASKNKVTNDDQAKLTKARLALTDEAERANWQKSIEQLEKRKKEASLALASNEQKKLKEEAEKAKQAKDLAQKKLLELEEIHRQKEEEQKKKRGEEQKIKDAEAEKKKMAKIDEILAAQKEIDKIKKDPSAGPVPIKTLTRDIGSAIGKDSLSLGKIVTKLPDEKSKFFDEKNRRTIMIGLGILLVIGGLATVLWTVKQKGVDSIADTIATRNSLIFADQQVALSLDKLTPAEAIQEINKNKQTDTDKSELIKEIYFTRQVTEKTDTGILIKTLEVDPTTIATSLGFNLPDEFLRLLEPKSMFGFYYYNKNPKPFYVFQTTTYKTAADVVLNNENTIVSELLNPYIDATNTNLIKDGKFKDKMVKNYDTRLIIDDTNSVIALYSWINKGTLVVTTDETTFSKVLNSYLAPKEPSK